MSKFIAIFVDDESSAYEATRALRALHGESSITLYSAAVLTKDSDGKIRVKGEADGGLVGTGMGALTGGLIGIFGGAIVAAAAPVAAAASAAVAAGGLGGLATGALVGSFWDIFNSGVSADFVREATTRLADGKTAVLAEIDGDWHAPLDTRIAALGGTVVRTWRLDFEDRQAAIAAQKERKEHEAAKAEWQAAREETKAKAKKRLDDAKAKLTATEQRIKGDIDKFNADTKAKIEALEKQVSSAAAENKAKLQKRIDDLKADRAVRSAKLKEAWELTKDALS